jgi:hypothetical protein
VSNVNGVRHHAGLFRARSGSVRGAHVLAYPVAVPTRLGGMPSREALPGEWVLIWPRRPEGCLPDLAFRGAYAPVDQRARELLG